MIVCGKRRNRFYFKFSVESSSFILTIVNGKILGLPLKVETDQLVICLVLPECLSVKVCCISPSDSEVNRDNADAESPFLLFFSFSDLFKNSSPREKVRKLSSFCEWKAESLFVSIIVAKYIIFPCANNGHSRGKIFLRSDLLTLSACTIGILSTLTYTDFDCVALLALL